MPSIMTTGFLRTSGAKIVDDDGNDVLLRGVSVPMLEPLTRPMLTLRP